MEQARLDVRGRVPAGQVLALAFCGDLLVPAWPHGNRLFVECPYCGGAHVHGGPTGGERVAHCLDGGGRSYTLVVEKREPAPAAIQRKIKKANRIDARIASKPQDFRAISETAGNRF